MKPGSLGFKSWKHALWAHGNKKLGVFCLEFITFRHAKQAAHEGRRSAGPETKHIKTAEKAQKGAKKGPAQKKSFSPKSKDKDSCLESLQNTFFFTQ